MKARNSSLFALIILIALFPGAVAWSMDVEAMLDYLDASEEQIIDQGRVAAECLALENHTIADVANDVLQDLDRQWRLLDWQGEAIAEVDNRHRRNRPPSRNSPSPLR